MKVAFWSNVHGQTATTSNLIIVSLLATIEQKLNNLITQSHFNLNNLEAALVGASFSETTEIFEDIGLDALARSVRTNVLDKEVFNNCSISYLGGKFHLLPGTTKSNKQLYEKEMLNTVPVILNAASSFYDMVFVDTSSGNSRLAYTILEYADVIVVNLCQNKFVLNDYFNNYKNNYKEKTVFLISNYNINSYFSLKNIRRMYNISKNNIAAIPYNVQFLDAQSNGEVLKFLSRNLRCEKSDYNYFFINESKKAAKMILDKTDIQLTKKVW